MPRIPFFPLNLVLFPRQALPLHIFEERYKVMINRCIDEHEPFGVVLIKSGEEVGEAAEPYDVGTTARIAKVQRLPDGQMNLITVGRQRFRIVELDESEPYLSGVVEYLNEHGAAEDIAMERAGNVAALFAEHLRLVMAISGQWAREVSVPGEPAQIADFVASQLEIKNELRQELLETLSIPDRLAKVHVLLGESIKALKERWEDTRKRRFAGEALN